MNNKIMMCKIFKCKGLIFFRLFLLILKIIRNVEKDLILESCLIYVDSLI